MVIIMKEREVLAATTATTTTTASTESSSLSDKVTLPQKDHRLTAFTTLMTECYALDLKVKKTP